MFNEDDNAYSSKWLKVKLTEKYDNYIQFFTCQSQSYISILPNTEKKCKARRTISDEEEACVYVRAVKMMKNKMTNSRHCTAYCTSVEVVIQHSQSFVSKFSKYL